MYINRYNNSYIHFTIIKTRHTQKSPIPAPDIQKKDLDIYSQAASLLF